MISPEQLRRISKKTGLNLRQQEKDYFLKLFLYHYYRGHEDAVFKGGTCLNYLFVLDRFSEVLDFNLLVSPKTFKDQVERVFDEFGLVGAEAHFLREELFEYAFTCEVGLHGPLYKGSPQTQNRIRIDAGMRGGTLRKPEWRLLSSEYPETRERFLILVIDEEEMLVEKVMALMNRSKGRDLYDLWFMLEKGIAVDEELFRRKGGSILRPDMIVTEDEYVRDLGRLTGRIIPYSQVRKEVERRLKPLGP